MLMLALNILTGIGLMAAIWAAYSMAKRAGKQVKWWQGMMLIVSAILFVFGFSWLGAGLGEEYGSTVFTQAALFGWGIAFGISMLMALVVFQLVRRQESK